MILVAGIAEESPVALVVDALKEIGANYRLFDQRRASAADITLEIAEASGGGAIGGAFTLENETIPLQELTGFYVRMMDDQLLPGIGALPLTQPRAGTAGVFTSCCFSSPTSCPGEYSTGPPT